MNLEKFRPWLFVGIALAVGGAYACSVQRSERQRVAHDFRACMELSEGERDARRAAFDCIDRIEAGERFVGPGAAETE
jgi:hypothetical protein